MSLQMVLNVENHLALLLLPLLKLSSPVLLLLVVVLLLLPLLKLSCPALLLLYELCL